MITLTLTYLVVKEPVVHLELDPRCRQQIHNGRWLEFPVVARHQAVTDDSRVRRHQVVLLRRSEFPRNISPETHSCTTHQRLLERIELAFRIARLDPLAILHRHRGRRALGFDGRVHIVQVLGAQFDAECEQVEDANVPREFVPLDHFVDAFEDLDDGAVDEGRVVGQALARRCICCR